MSNPLKHLIDFIYPPYCKICGGELKKEKVICNRCFDSIHFINNKRCKICGKNTGGKEICKFCRDESPPFDVVIAAGNYVTPLREIIMEFKYNNRLTLADRLSRMMYSVFISRGDLSFLKAVTWVPMNSVELRERGYNQSQILAEKFAELGDLKIYNILKKVRKIPSQTGLSEDERIKNVRGAYRVREDVFRDNKEELQAGLILIDDVFTTGSTLRECASDLKVYGVNRIAGLVLAISP